MRKVVIRSCDICESENDVKRVRIDIEGRTGRHAEFCALCRKPLERLMNRLDEKRKPRLTLDAIPVKTMEEVLEEVEAARSASTRRRKGA